jgi:hypothetical protein
VIFSLKSLCVAKFVDEETGFAFEGTKKTSVSRVGRRRCLSMRSILADEVEKIEF